MLTNRFATDDQQIPVLLEQIIDAIDHFTGDGAFDKTPVYEAVLHHSPKADVVISPSSNAVENTKAAPMRNRNIQEIKDQGRMAWQKNRNYGGPVEELTKSGISRLGQTIRVILL